MNNYNDRNVTIINPVPQNVIDKALEYKNLGFHKRNKKIKEDGNYLGQGCNGIVCNIDGFAVKFTNEHSSGASRDIEMLKHLNDCIFTPKLYAYYENIVIMEKINGITVDKLIEGGYDTRCKYNVVESILFQMESALYDIYKRGIIPSDMKADNSMITKDGRLKVVDTGTFCMCGEEDFFGGTADWESYENFRSGSYASCQAIEWAKRIDSLFLADKQVFEIANRNKKSYEFAL